MIRVIGRAFIFWLPLPFIGTLNGIFRGLVIQEFMSEAHAKQISSLLLVVLLAIYAYLAVPKLKLKEISEAWLVGLTWMFLTVLFEFGLGIFVSGISFNQLLSEYKLWEGRLWSLVIITILILPVLFYNRSASKRNSLSS
jgi:hypothetical protein